MTYDAIVTTVEGNHTYQNIEALDEWHLADMIQEDLKTEIINIKIKETFGEEFFCGRNLETCKQL